MSDTRQHCADNNIVSFSCVLKYDSDTKKKIPIIKCSTKKITADNFMEHHNRDKSGFAIMTGLNNLVVIDCDIDKAQGNFPQEITDTLDAVCKAIVKTPNGKHYYFKTDKNIKKQTNAKWNNQHIECLDIIADSSFVFAPPTSYTKGDSIVAYQWLVGDLSTVSDLPENIYNAIKSPMKKTEAIIRRIASADSIKRLLNGLSSSRFSDYDSWLKIGMILHNDGIENGVELWDEISQQKSPQNYEAGACQTKWTSFQTISNPATIATLFAWLKEDNLPLFNILKSNSNGVESLLLQHTHRTAAEVFYAQKPDQYIYSPNANIGWYVLQTNNVWAYHGKSIDCFKKIFYDTVAPLIEDLIIKYQIALEDETDKNISDKIKELRKTLDSLGSTPYLQNVITWLMDLYCVRDIHTKMDSNIMLYAFTDCVYDFNICNVREILPTDYINTTCGYKYPTYDNALKGVEDLNNFLNSLFENDDTKDYLLKTLAYSLCGKTNLQDFYLWKGRGGNGKGLLMSLLENTMGDYIRVLPISYFIKGSENKGQALPELALCKSARLVYATEPDSSNKEKLQASTIKGLTGDDKISARGLFKEPIEYKPQFKVVIQCNECKFNKIDPAIQRRLGVIDFRFEFKSDDLYCAEVENHRMADFSIEGRIKTPYARDAFILLLLEYYKLYIAGNKQNIPKPEAVKISSQEFLDDSNPVASWLSEKYQITTDNSLRKTSTEFVTEYNADRNNSITAKQFGDYMVLLGHYTKSSNGVKTYRGFLLKNGGE
jgi:P4 family phage/plasmid primase-like protien